MQRILFLFLILFMISPVYADSLEIEQVKPIESVHFVYSVDDENEATLESNHLDNKVQEDYLKNEIELKGSVIYNESSQYDNAIELDKTVEKPHINLKTSHMIIPVHDEKIKDSALERYARSAINSAGVIRGEEYIVTPMWSYIQEKTGNFSYGTVFSSGIDTAQLQTTMNIYTRYDFKHFALTGAVGTNESNVEGTMDQKIVQFSPEIKISKSFVIRDTIQAYVNENYKKNRLSIIYTPQIGKYPDILRFELGLSHTYYGGGRLRSAVEFSTKIRF